MFFFKKREAPLYNESIVLTCSILKNDVSVSCFLFPVHPVPEVAPVNVRGGGGSGGELVISWEVRGS